MSSKGERINILLRLPKEQNEKVLKIAQELGISRADFIYMAINKYIKDNLYLVDTTSK